MPAIAVDHLSKRYDDVLAVDDVSFVVEEGETFGILGPNGAGKTTTLEMMEGLTRPDSGGIEILGQPVWPHPGRVQQRIGVQLQKTALFERLNATEILDLFSRFYDVEPGKRTAELLATVGLEEKSDALVAQMSGGQQQRLSIALALVHEPSVVFLDEPTTGLDPQARRNLWDVIRAIGEEGRTVVLTTHYLEEAEELCRRTAIMDSGRVIALDTPAALVTSLGPRSRVIFSGDGIDRGALAGIAAVTNVHSDDGQNELTTGDVQQTLIDLVELAGSRNVELHNLSVRQPTLEDVFLELTGREYRE